MVLIFYTNKVFKNLHSRADLEDLPSSSRAPFRGITDQRPRAWFNLSSLYSLTNKM